MAGAPTRQRRLQPAVFLRIETSSKRPLCVRPSATKGGRSEKKDARPAGAMRRARAKVGEHEV